MKNIILALVLTLIGIWIWIANIPYEKQYNKYQCAVYGKMEDCKTPLPINERLK